MLPGTDREGRRGMDIYSGDHQGRPSATQKTELPQPQEPDNCPPQSGPWPSDDPSCDMGIFEGHLYICIISAMFSQV